MKPMQAAAHIEVAARRFWSRVDAAIAEQVKAFSNSEAGDYLSRSGHPLPTGTRFTSAGGCRELGADGMWHDVDGADLLNAIEEECEVFEPLHHQDFPSRPFPRAGCRGGPESTTSAFIRADSGHQTSVTTPPVTDGPSPVPTPDTGEGPPHELIVAALAAGDLAAAQKLYQDPPADLGSQRDTPGRSEPPNQPPVGQPDEDLQLLCRNASDAIGQWMDGEYCHDQAYWQTVVDRLIAESTK